MISVSQTQALTQADIKVLEQDAGKFKKAVKYSRIAAPVLLLVTILGFYFNVDGIVSFISVALTVAAFLILFVSYKQSRHIFADLKSNTKVVAPFTLNYKEVMGYVDKMNGVDEGGINSRQKQRRQVDITNQSIQKAIDDMAAYQSNPTANTLSDSSIEVLQYSYHFKGNFVDDKHTQQFTVPIQYYLVANLGDTVSISYAPRSKKVFAVKKV